MEPAGIKFMKDVLKSIDAKPDTKCAICYEDLTANVSELKCEHYFHHFCIDKWLRKNSTCPLCRSSNGRKSSSLEEDHHHIPVFLRRRSMFSFW